MVTFRFGDHGDSGRISGRIRDRIKPADATPAALEKSAQQQRGRPHAARRADEGTKGLRGGYAAYHSCPPHAARRADQGRLGSERRNPRDEERPYQRRRCGRARDHHTDKEQDQRRPHQEPVITDSARPS